MFDPSQAFSSFSVNDLQKAKEFYTTTLGLPVEEIPMGLLKVNLSPHKWVIIYEKRSHVPADFTLLNFPVKNIEKVVDKFIAKGIQFEQYEGDIATNAKGICSTGEGPDIAWFKDPSGNILALLEEFDTSNG
jgi:catechol 2,3-dioxygenase-like lactoylglutathione lyase family enzyme